MPSSSLLAPLLIRTQVASLQGYLLKNKTRPRECVDEVAEWVIQERETREKLKKEKAEVSFLFGADRCDLQLLTFSVLDLA